MSYGPERKRLDKGKKRAGSSKRTAEQRKKDNKGVKDGSVRIGANGKSYNVYDAKSGTWKRGKSKPTPKSAKPASSKPSSSKPSTSKPASPSKPKVTSSGKPPNQAKTNSPRPKPNASSKPAPRPKAKSSGQPPGRTKTYSSGPPNQTKTPRKRQNLVESGKSRGWIRWGSNTPNHPDYKPRSK